MSASFQKAAEKARAALDALGQVVDDLSEGTHVSQAALDELAGAKKNMENTIAQLEEQKTLLEDQLAELESALEALDSVLANFRD
jgi:ABC-type transporter Mla subunit MlaD